MTDTLPTFDANELHPEPVFINNLSGDAPEWAHDLNANLAIINAGNRHMVAVHEKILALVEELKPEVISVIDGLKSNPMLKMFLGGKR